MHLRARCQVLLLPERYIFIADPNLWFHVLMWRPPPRFLKVCHRASPLPLTPGYNISFPQVAATHHDADFAGPEPLIGPSHREGGD